MFHLEMGGEDTLHGQLYGTANWRFRSKVAFRLWKRCISGTARDGIRDSLHQSWDSTHFYNPLIVATSLL